MCVIVLDVWLVGECVGDVLFMSAMLKCRQACLAVM